MHVLSVVFTVLRFDSIGTVVNFRMHEATHEISAVLVKFSNIDSPITIQREAYSFEVLKSIYFTRKLFPLMLAFATGPILRVECNQNVESKIKIVEPKDPFCGVHIDALVGCSATLVL
jgi:ribosomal protein L35AE/L33A